jgi:hypothetical protein
MATDTIELIMAACVLAGVLGTTCSPVAQLYVKRIIRSVRIYVSDCLYRLGDWVHTLANMIDTDW